MAFRDIMSLEPGSRRRSEDFNPFAALHREMDRMFDEVFGGFGHTEAARQAVMSRAGCAISKRIQRWGATDAKVARNTPASLTIKAAKQAPTAAPNLGHSEV